MTPRFTILVAMITLMLAFSKPAAAQNRYIVRTTGGLSSVLNLCNLLQCQVQRGLDGPVGQNFLVTSSTNFLADLVNCGLTHVDSFSGTVVVYVDTVLTVPQNLLGSFASS